MPGQLGYEAGREKVGGAAVRGSGSLEARRIHSSSCTLLRRLQTIGPAMGHVASFARRRRIAPPTKDGRPPPEAGSRQIGATPEATGARTVCPRIRHTRLDHRAHRRPDLAPFPSALLPRLCEAPIDAAPRVEVAQTHLAAGGDTRMPAPEGTQRHSARSFASELFPGVIPRVSCGFARMKFGVGLQRRCLDATIF